MKVNVFYETSKIQEKQFEDYMELIIEWNKRINLTAITDRDEIIVKHFVDSLTINKYVDKNS